MMNAQNMQRVETFSPSKVDNRQLRDAFGKFATGVTVITCDSADGPICIAANSFSSLSLDPALVMWAIDVKSRRCPYFSETQHFAIHVMAKEQQELVSGAAKNGNFLSDIPHGLNMENVPLIEGCLARFECKTSACHPAGDHMIVVGEVLRAEMRDGQPLVFSAGEFGSFVR